MKHPERLFCQQLHTEMKKQRGILGSRMENSVSSGAPDLQYFSSTGYALFELKAIEPLANGALPIKMTKAQMKWWHVANRKQLRAWLVICVHVSERIRQYAIESFARLDTGAMRIDPWAPIPFDELVTRCSRSVVDLSFHPTDTELL